MLTQKSAKKLFVEIMWARGFTNEELSKNFKIHIGGKYRAESWTQLDHKEKTRVIEDAIKGEIDFPTPF